MKARKACTRGLFSHVCLHAFLSVDLGLHPTAGGQHAAAGSGPRGLVLSAQRCLFPTPLKLRLEASGAGSVPHGSCRCLLCQMRCGLSACLF